MDVLDYAPIDFDVAQSVIGFTLDENDSAVQNPTASPTWSKAAPSLAPLVASTTIPLPGAAAFVAMSGAEVLGASGSRYRLLKDLGTVFGSGSIWKAFSEKNDRIVAIRFFSTAASLAEVASEIENIKAILTSPTPITSILPVIDYRLADDAASSCIVYDAVAVRSLASFVDVDRVTEKIVPMPEPVARKLLLEMVRALTELHRAGIAHRSLSVSSFNVEPDYSLRLLTCGLAQFMMPQQRISQQLATRIGGLHSCFLPPPPPPTPSVAPLLLGESILNADLSSDIWNLGWILVQLVTGDSFFDVAVASCFGQVSRNDLATLCSAQIASSVPAFWAQRALNTQLSVHLIDLVSSMIEPVAAKRITLSEILASPWLTQHEVATPAQLVASLAFRQQSSPPGVAPPTSMAGQSLAHPQQQYPGVYGGSAFFPLKQQQYYNLQQLQQQQQQQHLQQQQQHQQQRTTYLSFPAVGAKMGAVQTPLDPPPPYGATSSALPLHETEATTASLLPSLSASRIVLGDAGAPSTTLLTTTPTAMQSLNSPTRGQFTSPPFCAEAVLLGICKRADCSAPHPPNTHWPSNGDVSSSMSAAASSASATTSPRWSDAEGGKEALVQHIFGRTPSNGDSAAAAYGVAQQHQQHQEPIQQGSPRAICKFSLKGGICQLPNCQFYHPPGTYQPRPLELLTQFPRPKPAPGYVCHNCGDTTGSHFKADCIHPQRCRYTAHGGVCTRPHCAFFHPPGTRIPPSGPFLPPASDTSNGQYVARPRPAAGYVCHNCGDTSLSHFKADCPHAQRCRYTTHGGICTRAQCQFFHPAGTAQPGGSPPPMSPGMLVGGGSGTDMLVASLAQGLYLQ